MVKPFFMTAILSFLLLVLFHTEVCAFSLNNTSDTQQNTTHMQAEDTKEQVTDDDCQIIPKQEASRTAQLETGGKVIDIKLRTKGKKSTYRVRVLIDEKRVKNITLDACR